MSNRHIISYLGVPIESNIVDVAEMELKNETYTCIRNTGFSTGTTDPMPWDVVPDNPYFSYSNGVFTVKKAFKGVVTFRLSFEREADGGLAAGNTFFGWSDDLGLYSNTGVASSTSLSSRRVAPYPSTLVDLEVGQTFSFAVNHTKGSAAAVRDCAFVFQALPDFTAVAAIAGQNKYIVKKLSGNVTSDGVIADLTVTNLTIGKVYEVGGQFDFRVNQSLAVTMACGSDSQLSSFVVSGISGNFTFPVSFKFTAKATTLTFTAAYASVSSYVSTSTRITVTEHPNDKEVSSF